MTAKKKPEPTPEPPADPLMPESLLLDAERILRTVIHVAAIDAPVGFLADVGTALGYTVDALAQLGVDHMEADDE